MRHIANLLAWLSGQAPAVPAIDHSLLGRIQPSHRPKDGPWLWETLDPVRHVRGPVAVTWLADENGPTEAQIAFWCWLRDNIEPLTEQARSLLGVDVQAWTGKPLPADPWDELIWVGAGLPPDGNRESDWDVSFETRARPGVMLTVHFEKNRPLLVTADD